MLTLLPLLLLKQLLFPLFRLLLLFQFLLPHVLEPLDWALRRDTAPQALLVVMTKVAAQLDSQVADQRGELLLPRRSEMKSRRPGRWQKHQRRRRVGMW